MIPFHPCSLGKKVNVLMFIKYKKMGGKDEDEFMIEAVSLEEGREIRKAGDGVAHL